MPGLKFEGQREGWIYALVDSRDLNTIRYVGKTISGMPKRFSGHMKKAATGRSRCAKWIRSVQQAGAEVRMIQLAHGTFTVEELNDLERAYIAQHRTEKLTNLTDGGDGGYNAGLEAYNRRNWTDAERAAHAERMRAFYQEHEHPGTERAVAGSAAAWADAQAREIRSTRISAAQTAYWAQLSSEERQARARDPKRISKISKAARELQADPEYRARMSDSVKKSWTPERRAAQAARMREMRARMKSG